MKRHDQEGRAGCLTRGSASALTSNVRLTGAEGIRCAKCTKSPMNLRGPASGRYRPFGSCIHAPRGIMRPARVDRLRTTACCAALAWRGPFSTRRGESKPTRNRVRGEGEACKNEPRTGLGMPRRGGGRSGRIISDGGDQARNGFPEVRRLCHNVPIVSIHSRRTGRELMREVLLSGV
jgi:hypothetical protein